MGREGRQRQAAAKAGAVKLSEAEFWKFRALVNEVGAIESEASQAAARYRQRIADASTRTREFFAALGETHGFDPQKQYRWDDATCELFEVDQT